MMDGVPSKVNVLLWIASYPWLMFLEGVQSWVDFLIVLFYGLCPILVNFLIVLFMEGVQSFVKVLFAESVRSWSIS